MQKEFLNYLISESKKFVKSHKIFDIVLYGSSIKGKPNANDIDILIIFENETLKKRAETSQELKESLKKQFKIDIKTINLKELFEEEFLARQGILTTGYSLLHNEEFARRMGFKGFSIFTYNLKNMNHREKTRFTYALIGRRNQKGIIKQINAIPLGKGAVKVPIKESLFFEEFLSEWKVNYTKKDILEAE